MSTKRRRFSWKTLRVSVQVLAFLAFTAYFLSIVFPLKQPWPADTLFMLDPLTHLYLLLSGEGVPHWIWALVALVLLFAVSRLFCGWLCPLGAMLDFVSGLRGRLKLMNRGKRTEARQRAILPAYFDLYLVIALMVLALFGLPLLWIFDPIVFSFKFLTVTLLPLVDEPLRLAYNALDARFYMSDWWYPVQNAYQHYFEIHQQPVYTDTAMLMLFAAAILGLEFWQRRFWCRYICPLGALLRLTYRLHPVRRRVRPDCSYCLACEVACHFGGSTEDDCLYCMECIEHCKPGQISFLPGRKPLKQPREAPAEDDVSVAVPPTVPAEPLLGKAAYRARVEGELQPARISRRMMLTYAAGGVVAVPLLSLFDNRTELPPDFIRPPGVGDDEARFTDLCIKCGQCLKVCLTNGLQPALTEAGLSALWTPRLIFRLGECEYNCNLCGQACPTGAIPKLELKEKQEYKLGVAFIDKTRCIPYITPYNCSICEEHCPTPDKAIVYEQHWATRDGERVELLRPIVDERLCTGCGICERVCPLAGQAAARIFRTSPGPAFNAGALEEYGTAGGGEYADSGSN